MKYNAHHSFFVDMLKGDKGNYSGYSRIHFHSTICSDIRNIKLLIE